MRESGGAVIPDRACPTRLTQRFAASHHAVQTLTPNNRNVAEIGRGYTDSLGKKGYSLARIESLSEVTSEVC
jgi:hypothetical protein